MYVNITHLSNHVITTRYPFRWTGSDTNPRNNDGQGKRGTDRSNVILIRSDENKSQPRVNGQWSRNYPAKITDGNFLGLPEKDLKSLATVSGKQMNISTSHVCSCINQSCLFLYEPIMYYLILINHECSYINLRIFFIDSPYFDLPPRMVKGCGTYYYMSTRNNAFSNRSQKGRIIVNSCK